MILESLSLLMRAQKAGGKKILLPFISLLLTLLFSGAAARAGQQEHKVERISVDELILLVAKKKPVTIIDVRLTDSYNTKIKGALEIPLDEIESNLKKIPRNTEIVTYCA